MMKPMGFQYQGVSLEVTQFTVEEAQSFVGVEYGAGWYFRPVSGIWFGPYEDKNRAITEAKLWVRTK